MYLSTVYDKTVARCKVFWSLATVIFYSASSLGDKYISAKLRCNVFEFSFLVGLATAVFLALLLPVLGWEFAFTGRSFASLAAVVALKIVEFYTSALLLKHVSAYELKVWLSLNVALSYLADLLRARAVFFFAFVPCALLLAAGVAVVALGERRKTDAGGHRGTAALCLLYIVSKFLYGFQMNALPTGVSSHSVLLLAMLTAAALQLPFLHCRAFFRKRGLAAGALTRVTNAAGLLTEAFAAQQNLLLYALVQPMQLALLFAAALVRRERPDRDRTVGTLLTLAAVCAMTVLIFIFGG